MTNATPTETLTVTAQGPAPDFAIAVTPTPGSVAVNQNVTWNGTLTALNPSSGTVGGVDLTCTVEAPATCTVAPPIQIPAPSPGAPYTVALSSPAAGMFTVMIQGTDGTLTHTTPAEPLTVTAQGTAPDFNIAVTPTPGSTEVNQNVTWTGVLTALNGYDQGVTLSCTAGAPSTCAFAPQVVTPTSTGTPFTLTLGSATAGTFTFTIQGTDGTLTHATAPETLTVGDFQIALTPTPGSVGVGQPITWYGTLTALSGYIGTVTLSCSAGAPQICIPSAPVNPTTTGARFGVTLDNQTNGTFNFTIQGTDGIVTHATPTETLIVGTVVTVSPAMVNMYADETGNSWPVGATQQLFTATVNGSNNPNVTWAVTGGSANGTISASGLYTSPAVVPIPATVTVTATSPATTAPGSATVNVETPTPLGTFPITVSATAVGGAAHGDVVSLTVQ